MGEEAAYFSWTFARGGFQATGGILNVEANAEIARGEGFVGFGGSEGETAAVGDDDDGGSSLGTPRSRDRKFSVAVNVQVSSVIK